MTILCNFGSSYHRNNNSMSTGVMGWGYNHWYSSYQSLLSNQLYLDFSSQSWSTWIKIKYYVYMQSHRLILIFITTKEVFTPAMTNHRSQRRTYSTMHDTSLLLTCAELYYQTEGVTWPTTKTTGMWWMCWVGIKESLLKCKACTWTCSCLTNTSITWCKHLTVVWMISIHLLDYTLQIGR